MRGFEDTVKKAKKFLARYNTKEGLAELGKNKLLYGKNLPDTVHSFDLETQSGLFIDYVFNSLDFSDSEMAIRYPKIEKTYSPDIRIGLTSMNLTSPYEELNNYEAISHRIKYMEDYCSHTIPDFKFGGLSIFEYIYDSNLTKDSYMFRDLIGVVDNEIVFMLGLPQEHKDSYVGYSKNVVNKNTIKYAADNEIVFINGIPKAYTSKHIIGNTTYECVSRITLNKAKAEFTVTLKFPDCPNVKFKLSLEDYSIKGLF